jgi:hypothetical protein
MSPVPGGSVGLDLVECTTTPLCFAVGGVETVTGSYRPVVARRTAPGAWVATELPVPGDTDPVVNASFWDVECASPTLCVAVGSYATPTRYRGLALAWNGSTWSAHAVTEPTAAEDQTSLHSVDCPTPTACVVIGSYDDDATGDGRPLALTYDGTAWSAAVSPPLPPSTSDAELQSVSCLSATQCVAVGYRYATPSGDQLPYVVGLAGGVWQVATVGLPAGATASPQDAGLEAVSCVVDGPTGQCVATGYYEDAAGDHAFLTRLATGSPTWVSTQVPVPGDAAADPNADLFAVECPNATDCRAIGQYTPTGGGRQSLLTRIVAGVPTSQTGPTPPSTATTPSVRGGALACRAVDVCLASGSYIVNQVDESAVFVQTLGPGGWSVAVAPTPAGAIAPSLYGVAYLGTAGVLAGTYRTAGGGGFGMLLEIP